MKRRIGFLGLPNVGKSSLFNAITMSSRAEVSNYAFTTIQPNVAKIDVRDKSLEALAKAARSKRSVFVQIEFIDIAGLIKGASEGAGLGNQFLTNVREVPSIAHVVRCFDNDVIAHVEKSVDPVRDVDTIETELMLADMKVLERFLGKTAKHSRGVAEKVAGVCLEKLGRGEPLRAGVPIASPEEHKAFQALNLLSSKPTVFIANVAEDEAAAGNRHSRALNEYVAKAHPQCRVVTVSAALEAEISALASEEERDALRRDYGVAEAGQGLESIISVSNDLLGLGCFYTVGPEEARAWTIKKGMTARDAAGQIHTDIASSFIAANVLDYEEALRLGGDLSRARTEGKLRTEGPNYVVQDRDVILFRHNK
jgi:GTP-binding protein YchF